MRENKILVCQDCFRKFIFTVAQQEHFDANGWQVPKRCPNCRAAKKRASCSSGNLRTDARRGYAAS